MGEESEDMSALWADFGTKLRDIEERNSMIKDRLLLLSQSFLRQEERLSKEIAMMRDEMKEIRMDLDRSNENIQHIIRENSEFARRDELKVIEKYLKLWEPLKFIKEDDVKKMINDKLKK